MLVSLLDWWVLIDWRRVRRAVLEGGLALVAYLGLAVAVTWPVVAHLDTVVLGGGELGGWLWRQWWHFQEIEALGRSDLSWIDRAGLLVGLGRYPETGNILDILLLSYPLDRWFGFPVHHNLKVLLVLSGNGLCGYALARSFTDSRAVALAAGMVAILNPIVIQDVNKTGLRQVLLWWLLLYPLFLARAQRTGSRLDGVLAGLCFVLVAAFYWFYGLFAAMFTVLHLGAWAWRERPGLWAAVRWLLPMAVAAGLGTLVFVSPYLSSGAEDAGRGGVEKLPELTFFLPFPAYDTIAQAPLRPSSYRENVLASLHRTIQSGWPADYVLDPRHGALALPAVVVLMGVLPALFLKRARAWVVIWVVFWLGTLGPFLKLGAQKDTSEVVLLGEHVVRLPYALMFQFVPGMSRMFAPYRMASMVVVASVVLVAISLGSAGPLLRRLLAPLAIVGIGLQLFYRFDLGPVEEGSDGPAMWRVPTQVSAFSVPDWYQGLDPERREGLIELPLEQAQDVVCAYQSVHRQKVYRSWATLPAVPPPLRRSGGGDPARRMRWLAKAEPPRDTAEPVLRDLSREPLEHDAAGLTDAALVRLMDTGDYRWLVVHERGYHLVDSARGGVMYRHAVRVLAERLGLSPEEHTEFEAFDWPGKARNWPDGPAWVPWSSREVHLPGPQMPSRYFMSVFDLAAWRAALPPGADEPDDGSVPAAPPEGAPPEGAPPEGAPPEGAPPEGTPPEAAPPEAAPPEAAPPEGAPPEGAPPEAAPSEAAPAPAPPPGAP